MGAGGRRGDGETSFTGNDVDDLAFWPLRSQRADLHKDKTRENATAAQHPYKQIPAGTTMVRHQRNRLTYCYPVADLGNATFSPWPPEQQACNDNTQRF